MKLKDIVQVTIFTVVAFILNMAVSTATGMLGTLSLYIAAGFSSFVVAPPFIIMAKKLQKKRNSFYIFHVAGCILCIKWILANAYSKCHRSYCSRINYR